MQAYRLHRAPSNHLDLTPGGCSAFSLEMPLPPFQTLLDAHGTDIHRFLVASVGALEADDCYQETWLAALAHYPRLRDASNLRGWLLTIAHRKAIDRVRARQRAAVPVGDSPQCEAGALADSEAQPSPAEGDGDGVWELVRRLPDKQRTAVTLRYVLDADYATIAETMAISPEAARQNVHEALKRLRTEYQR
ncbi:MAG: RNA polymerase sigma factor [Solirubrobacteraceae bacterium]